MITPGELKKGISIELDGQLWKIIDFEHIKVGRGGAISRLKLQNWYSGSIIERTFPASERFKRVYLERSKVQFLYHDGDFYHFMDSATFEQHVLSRDQIGDDANYLRDGLEVELLKYGDETIGVELPPSVDLKVAETEPGFKGDTATGGSKPATLETGLKIMVPLFVEKGDTIRVDTRSGEYLGRVI